MKNKIRAMTLLFFVFAAAVFLISFNGPVAAVARDLNADDYWYGWQKHKDDSDPVMREKAVKAFYTAYEMDMAKGNFRDVLDFQIKKGYIKEIVLDGLADVKAKEENALVAIFNPNAPVFINKHEAIVLKNLFELEGGREGKIKFYFIDTSKDYERAKKIRNEEFNLYDDVALIQFIFEDGRMITDAYAGIAEYSEKTLYLLTVPKDEKEIDNLSRWMENFNPDKPGFILYKGGYENPTYELKTKH